VSTTTNESILDTLTDDERRAAETFIRDQRAARSCAAQGRKLADEYIARANERAASKTNPLDGQRHHFTARG
jgi:hypothetical protein